MHTWIYLPYARHDKKLKGTVPPENRRTSWIDFIAINESRRIQLQFATNRIKIGPLEPEIQPPKVRNVVTL